MSQLTKYNRRTEPARILRRDKTEAEEKLWRRLRNQHFRDYKFRRQFPIGPYFADFCCLKSRLIIEVDGMHHLNQVDDDANRTEYLASQGYRTLRFWNHEVLSNANDVCGRILNVLKNGSQSPLPAGEGRPSSEAEGRGEA